MKRLMTFLVVFAAAPAFPQSLEVTALAGYTTPGGLQHDSRTVEDLKLAGSSTFGASLGYFFSPRFGVEASWVRVGSGVELSAGGATQEMLDVTIDQLQASFVYQLGGAESRLRPFVLAGAGAAIFSSTDVDGVVNSFSWDFGDGSFGGGVRPMHIFDRPGTYRVFLTIEGEKVGIACRANAVLTELVTKVERGELKADPRHITELRLN